MGQEVLSHLDGGPEGWPVVETFNNQWFVPRSVRDLAVRLYGRPDEIEVDHVVDLVVLGAGPAGL